MSLKGRLQTDPRNCHGSGTRCGHGPQGSKYKSSLPANLSTIARLYFWLPRVAAAGMSVNGTQPLRRTKIVSTLGPASFGKVREMIEAGEYSPPESRYAADKKRDCGATRLEPPWTPLADPRSLPEAVPDSSAFTHGLTVPPRILVAFTSQMQNDPQGSTSFDWWVTAWT